MSSEILQIDEFDPSAQVGTVDGKEAFWLRHGGVCTRLNWSAVERMEIADFLKKEVPQLGKEKDDLYVVRNSVGGSVTFIIGDCVLKYRITDMEETDLDTMTRYLTVDEEAWNSSLPYPVVAFAKGKSGVKMTMAVEAKRRTVRIHYGRDESKVDSFDIWTPPLWFKVSMSLSGALNKASLAVAPERAVPWYTTKLKQWPLSHSGVHGDLCLGNSVFEEQPQDMPGFTPYERTLWFTYMRFFGARWNHDMFHPNVLNSGELVDSRSMEYAAWNAAHPASGTWRDMTDVLYMLRNQDGWQRIKYSKLSCCENATEFVNA